MFYNRVAHGSTSGFSKINIRCSFHVVGVPGRTGLRQVRRRRVRAFMRDGASMEQVDNISRMVETT